MTGKARLLGCYYVVLKCSSPLAGSGKIKPYSHQFISWIALQMEHRSHDATQAKLSAKNQSGAKTHQAKVLAGAALLRDMEKHRKEVTTSEETARQFLIDLGVLTPSGKRKTLIRD